MMNWKARAAAFAFGAYILTQGVGQLRNSHLVYWNVSRRFILYPEIQITFGIILLIVAVLPLRRIVEGLTSPILNSRHPMLKPFWKRRHKSI
jgi:hypothetical protein